MLAQLSKSLFSAADKPYKCCICHPTSAHPAICVRPASAGELLHRKRSRHSPLVATDQSTTAARKVAARNCTQNSMGHGEGVTYPDTSGVTAPLLPENRGQEHASSSNAYSYQPDYNLPAFESNPSPPSVAENLVTHVQVPRNRDASTLPAGPPPPIGNYNTYPELSPQQDYPPRSGDVPQIQQVIVVHTSSYPPTVVCPHCHRQGPTIQYKASGFCTWFTASLCCVIGCCLLFPFVFCCDSLKDTVHYCSHCRRYIGRTAA